MEQGAACMLPAWHDSKWNMSYFLPLFSHLCWPFSTQQAFILYDWLWYLNIYWWIVAWRHVAGILWRIQIMSNRIGSTLHLLLLPTFACISAKQVDLIGTEGFEGETLPEYSCWIFLIWFSQHTSTKKHILRRRTMNADRKNMLACTWWTTFTAALSILLFLCSEQRKSSISQSSYSPNKPCRKQYQLRGNLFFSPNNIEPVYISHAFKSQNLFPCWMPHPKIWPTTWHLAQQKLRIAASDIKSWSKCAFGSRNCPVCTGDMIFKVESSAMTNDSHLCMTWTSCNLSSSVCMINKSCCCFAVGMN